MISNLMEEIVVWQIAPDEEHITLNGEEGIPYILPDGSNWLAILKDGQVIDSISIDITKNLIADAINKSHDHVFCFWEDGSSRLVANPSIVKRAMRNRTTLLNAGWSYEYAWFVLWSAIDDALKKVNLSDPLLAVIGYIGGLNFDTDRQHYMLSQAVEAYDLYMSEFDLKIRLKQQEKIKAGECETFDIMHLAILIALINPCVDRQWDYKCNRQGVHSQRRCSKRLVPVVEFLQGQRDELLHELYLMKVKGECSDPDEYELIRGEITVVRSMLESLEIKFEPNTMEKYMLFDAIEAAKDLLKLAGIPCGTNTIEKEWTHFVATAWGVTPSQVVSAAKALKKRESQEQK